MTQSLLEMHCKPFDAAKLATYEGVLHYDGCEQEDILDFLNTALCENAWGCGCGRPDEATSFFFAQFAELYTGKDYHRLPGGLDLFKYSCWKMGLINSDLTYTQKGLELLELPKLFFKVDWEGYTSDMVVEKAELADISADKAKLAATAAVVFGDLTNAPVLDYQAALLYVGILGDYLFRKQQIPWSQSNTSAWAQLEGARKPTFEGYEGEWYNSFHSLEQILEMEEHGGSTPGWLEHTKGVEKQAAIVKLFGRQDLFMYCLN